MFGLQNIISGISIYLFISRLASKSHKQDLLDQISIALKSNHFIFSSFLEYLPVMDNSVTYEALLDKGFLAKNRKKEKWNKKDKQLLLETIHQLTTGIIKPQVKDWAYYISHYTFEGAKSAKEIHHKINQLLREQLDISQK